MPPRPARSRRLGENTLRARGLPNVCEIAGFETLGLAAPGPAEGQAVRVWARSLSVMQKEAIVYSSLSGRAWRLASDEGPYLNGHDEAPCPLSFMTVGMAASYRNEIAALAAQRGIEAADVAFTQHNTYTMQGSIRDGSMRGGARPVELEAALPPGVGRGELERLLADAVRLAPVQGLVVGARPSSFTLTANGRRLRLDPALELGREPAPAARGAFERVAPVPGAIDCVEKRTGAEARAGVAGGAGTSLQERQDRVLHLKAVCRRRHDGATAVEQELLSPLGSTFAFISDEHGGRGIAPDAAVYASAGLAFCFMTQLGRYAKILGRDLSEYAVVQDTHFSLGGASHGTGEPGSAAAVETHVHVVTSEDDEFARACVRIGEQTCFLHALCRTPLETQLKIGAEPQ